MLASAVLALAMPGGNVQIWCNPSQQHDKSTSPCSVDTDSSDPAWYLQRCVFVYMFIIVSVTMVTSHTHEHSEMNLLSHFYRPLRCRQPQQSQEPLQQEHWGENEGMLMTGKRNATGSMCPLNHTCLNTALLCECRRRNQSGRMSLCLKKFKTWSPLQLKHYRYDSNALIT